MWHVLIAVGLALHGIGHAVGFWMPVPGWFAIAWLLPGLGFLGGAWGAWLRAGWWPAVAVGAAVLSELLLVLVPAALQLTPYGSALVFNLLAVVALLVPWSRRRVLAA